MFSATPGLYLDVKSELEPCHSCDIVSDMDMIGAHRRRSNTAQRLDRLRKERKNQAKVKVIHWRDSCYSSETLSGTHSCSCVISFSHLVSSLPPVSASLALDSDQAFPVKKLSRSSEISGCTGSKNVKSCLSLQLEKHPQQPNNPFKEFSRFDGRSCDWMGSDACVKRISVFLSSLLQSVSGADAEDASDETSMLMETSVVSGARVRDLIGLICWHYVNEGRKPALPDPCVDHYSLRIAEENGDVDPDFPCLNPKEPVAKFGFPFLALVYEKPAAQTSGEGLTTAKTYATTGPSEKPVERVSEEEKGKTGPDRDLNPGPLAPEARIIPLDQRASQFLLCSLFFDQHSSEF